MTEVLLRTPDPMSQKESCNPDLLCKGSTPLRSDMATKKNSKDHMAFLGKLRTLLFRTKHPADTALLQKFQRRIDELEAEKAAFQNRTTKALNEAAASREEAAAIKKKDVTISNDHQKATIELRIKERHLEARRKEVGELKAETAVLLLVSGEKEVKMKRLQSQIQTLESQVKDLQSQEKELQDHVREQMDRVKGLLSSNATLHTQLLDLTAELENKVLVLSKYQAAYEDRVEDCVVCWCAQATLAISTCGHLCFCAGESERGISC